jgi:hypothetical protein
VKEIEKVITRVDSDSSIDPSKVFKPKTTATVPDTILNSVKDIDAELAMTMVKNYDELHYQIE